MLSNNNIQVVTPEQMPILPKKMYALGNIGLLLKPSMAVAGTRKINSKSVTWLHHMISHVNKDWVITSGLALGSDAVAHKAAMQYGLGTIAVLPSGIKNILPKTNINLARKIVMNGGLLLSEYEPHKGIDLKFHNYKERNKIIMDISKSLIVPQFEKHSGTRSTVDFAQQQNKRIIVQNADYSGNQFIINSDSYNTFTI